MWPWGHLAFGYLWYRLVGHRWEWPHTDSTVIALAFGTQFPDIIDKPLAWTLAILPSGRSLAHSLLTATIVIAVALAIARYLSNKSIGVAFAVGYLSHLLGDALVPLFELDPVYLRFLLWPLYPPPPYESDTSFLEHFLNIETNLVFVSEIVMVGFVAVLWISDGCPGIRWLWSTRSGR
ncbi:hypothetical protein AUR64_14285 [Haloprofundus marisrubri]|uniref:Metal-dependent hydrolase n=1 Tax=Haloprofundus marisrubri TaxID=1514971 RepID=A0A0W1R6D2_9EURY|nr:metal-dependent hydrolase [Haloprofundus marisrubri]KTG08973.1 hypothetical protein AUR64_14285 [Haloprofundus marisrubri]